LLRIAGKDPKNQEGRMDLKEGQKSQEGRMVLGERVSPVTLAGKLDTLLETAIPERSSPPKMNDGKKRKFDGGSGSGGKPFCTPRVRNPTRLTTLMKTIAISEICSLKW
jgi:hypothetical protein